MKLTVFYILLIITFIANIVISCIFGANLANVIAGWLCAIIWCLNSYFTYRINQKMKIRPKYEYETIKSLVSIESKIDLEKQYTEIFVLANYCQEIGVKYTIKRYFNGFQLRFNKGDVIQRFGSFGCDRGCVEFGGTGIEDFDYTAIELEAAKEFVLKYKDLLNGKEG